MTVSFETKTSVFTENAELLGDIEDQGGGWTFTAAAEIPLSADELRAIADKLDELNGVKDDEQRTASVEMDAS